MLRGNLAITTFQNQLLQLVQDICFANDADTCNNHIPKSVIATASHLGISTKTLSAI